MHANVNITREKRADTKVHINSGTFVIKKFNEVRGVFRAQFSSSRQFQIYLFLTHR